MKVKKIVSVVLTAVLVALMLPMNILPVSAAELPTTFAEDTVAYVVEPDGSYNTAGGDSVVEFKNIREAVLSLRYGVNGTENDGDDAPDGSTGVMVKDDNTGWTANINLYSNVTIEGNGYTVTCVSTSSNFIPNDNSTASKRTGKVVTINNLKWVASKATAFSPRTGVTLVLNDCEVTASKNCILGQTDSKTVIRGGKYVSNTNTVSADSASVVIYDGFFEGNGDIVLDATQSTATTAENEVTTSITVYDGTFINRKEATSASFAVRPRKGAMTKIYGGEFVSYGAPIGVGETGNGGWLYVFGGSFKKIAADGYNTVDFNVTASSAAAKNIYLYGGEYYTGKTTDASLLAGAYKTYEDAKYNRVNPEALTITQGETTDTYTDEKVTDFQFQCKTTISYDLTKDATAALSVTLPGGLTVGTDSAYRAFDRIACDGSTVALLADITDTVKAPALDALTVDYDGHTAAALDLSACTNLTEIKADTVLFTGADYFQLANSNETSTDIRFVTAIDKAESAEYVKAGFLISLGNRTPRMGGAKVITTETREVYTSLRAAEEDVAAPDGAYWLACAVRGIPADAYDTVIWIRPYAVDADGNVVYGASFAVCVADGLG